MQEWFEILWEGVEAAKNHHHLEKKMLFGIFLVSINGHYWEQGLVSLNKPYYKLHRFNPLVNKRNKWPRRVNFLQSGLLQCLGQKCWKQCWGSWPYLVMQWNMCFSDHFCGFNMQEWFEILWEGVEAAKNHHHLEKKMLFGIFLVSINGHYWEQGLVSLNKPYYKLHRFNPLVNKRNKWPRRVNFLQSGLLQCLEQKCWKPFWGSKNR